MPHGLGTPQTQPHVTCIFCQRDGNGVNVSQFHYADAVGVFEDTPAEVLQLVSALGIASTLRWARMAVLPGDFDDDTLRSEEKVDPCDMSVALALDCLRERSVDSGLSANCQESPFEWRVTSTVENKVLNEATPPTAATAQRFEASRDCMRCRQSFADRTVDRSLDSFFRTPCQCQIQDGASRRGAANSVDTYLVDQRNLVGRVHAEG
jgi:hypothetical protein